MTGLAPAAILWLLFAVGLAAAFSPLPRRPEPGVSALGSSEGEPCEHPYTRPYSATDPRAYCVKCLSIVEAS